jgi:transcriptional regulator with XRE-family HTH domain
MSMGNCGATDSSVGQGAAIPLPCAGRPLHRLAIVRQQQGLTRRCLARRLGIDVSRVKCQERATSDMLLSALYEWQRALETPVAELLIDADDPLSPPVLKRAQMVRLMKTAAAIVEQAQQTPIRRLAHMLVDQLVEIMPELAGVSPWHTVGKRRTREELGQVAQRPVGIETFRLFRE